MPVVRVDARRAEVIRGADVVALLADPRIVQIPGANYIAAMGIPEGRLAEFLRTFMLLSVGPDHARRRGPVNASFSAPAMRRQREIVRAVAERIVSAMPVGEPFEFVETVASRIPAEMIAAILGLPAEDADWFRTRVYAVTRCFSPPYAVEDHAEIEAATGDLLDYVAGALADRRAAPRDDLLSALAAEGGHGALDDRELAHQVLGLIGGGSDTTRAGIALILSQLHRTPGLWARLVAEPDLIPAAVAEALRLEPPVASLPRFAAAPVDVGGVTIPGGVMVALSTISAMRDPDLFPDPDRFDLTRSGGPRLHLAYGGGAHRCLGESLSRIEMEETLAALIALAPGLEVLAHPEVRGFGGIRRIGPMLVRQPEGAAA